MPCDSSEAMFRTNFLLFLLCLFKFELRRGASDFVNLGTPLIRKTSPFCLSCIFDVIDFCYFSSEFLEGILLTW